MHTYEQLSGASGRHVFYRAERFKARDIFPQLRAEVEVGDETLSLIDLSMTGLGIRANDEASWARRLGSQTGVRLRLGEHVLLEGEASICRVDPDRAGVTIGLGLRSGFLDIPELIARRDAAMLRLEISESLSARKDDVDPAYRQFTTELLGMLRSYRSVLDRFEQKTNGLGRADASEAAAICEERIIPEWRELWRRGNELVLPYMSDAKRFKAIKRFTELVITPELVPGPIWRRSYEKPLGYPGDFEIMKQVYAWKSDGDTAYGRLMHRIGLEVAECIATRMRMVQQSIAEIVAAPAGDRPEARITSIGSGPAEEVVNYLTAGEIPRPVTFTLIDQEHQALEYAYQRIIPLSARCDGKATVSCLHLSFVDLARRTNVFSGLEPQDFIYTVGLVDYLSPARAKSFAANLFERLAPGGLLVIGNMRDMPQSNFWPMEVICDWSVKYRNEAEMWEIAGDLPAVSATLETDPTGRVYMLSLRKG